MDCVRKSILVVTAAVIIPSGVIGFSAVNAWVMANIRATVEGRESSAPKKQISELLQAARAELISGNFAEAIAGARQALALDPGLPGSYEILGQALYGLKSYYASTTALREAIRLSPAPNPALFELLASALHADGRSDEAIRTFHSARTIAKIRSIGAELGLAEVELAEGRKGEAEHYLGGVESEMNILGALCDSELVDGPDSTFSSLYSCSAAERANLAARNSGLRQKLSLKAQR